jgi:hypothetical protein
MRLWGVCPLRGLRPALSFFFVSWPLYGEWASSALCSYHDVLGHHRPKATGPSNHGWKPLEPRAKINLSSFQVDYLGYSVTMIER